MIDHSRNVHYAYDILTESHSYSLVFSITSVHKLFSSVQFSPPTGFEWRLDLSILLSLLCINDGIIKQPHWYNDSNVAVELQCRQSWPHWCLSPISDVSIVSDRRLSNKKPTRALYRLQTLYVGLQNSRRMVSRRGIETAKFQNNISWTSCRSVSVRQLVCKAMLFIHCECCYTTCRHHLETQLVMLLRSCHNSKIKGRLLYGAIRSQPFRKGVQRTQQQALTIVTRQ